MQTKQVKLIVVFGLIAFNSLTYAEGDVSTGQAKAALCISCHGQDGNSVMPGTPSLAGQPTDYLIKQLHDFKTGKRNNPTMTAMVAGLDDQAMEDISAFFASQKLNPVEVEFLDSDQEIAVTEKRFAAGQQLFQAGRISDGIPACSACHGSLGYGNAPSAYPLLRGQSATYLIKTLTDFSNKNRANDPNEMMRDIAGRLKQQDLYDIVSYLSSGH